MACYACPHCGKTSISCWRKLGIGPARRAPCPTCGKAVSVAWLPSIGMQLLSSAALWMSIVPVFSLLGPMEPHWFFSALAISVAIVQLPLVWAYCRFVPLVARDA